MQVNFGGVAKNNDVDAANDDNNNNNYRTSMGADEFVSTDGYFCVRSVSECA